MTFLSIGFAFYTGPRLYAVYPLNILLYPLLKLLKLDDAPLVTRVEFDEETPALSPAPPAQ